MVMKTENILTFLNYKVLKPKPIPLSTESKYFEELDAVWKPEKGEPGVILRWFISGWCNYNCPYCSLEHERDRSQGTFKAHSFDNYPPEKWVGEIEKNFKHMRVAMTITGGEPMLDKKNMGKFLKELLPKSFIDNIRIDTNASWNPSNYKDLPNKEKIIFMCTLHPSQTKIDEHISRLKSIQEHGFTIGMVNYVLSPEQSSDYKELAKKYHEIDIPLHTNPLWGSEPAGETRKILEEVLDKVDFFYRSGNKTKGKICYYPNVSYEMNQNGDITPGCFRWISKSIFEDGIPELPEAPVKCPHQKCLCLDMYSFIKGINRNTDLNILKIYGNMLRKKMNIPLLK